MVDRTASVTGNWANTATWGGSAAPTTSQTWHINSGVTVHLAADPGSLTGAGDIDGILSSECIMTGTLGPITINNVTGAKLYGHRTISNFLRVAGTITSNVAGGVDYGTTDDYMTDLTKCSSIEFVCASDNLASRGFVLGVANALSIKGAARLKETTLGAVAAIGATSITLAANMALRPGTIAQAMQGLADIICVGHTPITTNNGDMNDEIDIYLVTSYDPDTKVVGLADVGAGQTSWARGGTPPML